MPSPLPPVPLKGGCSVIHNNTLYTYTPDAFQSISLSENATWKQLPMLASVTGAVCVQAIPSGDVSKAIMFLVGGATNVSTDYPGMSYYSFADRKWTATLPAVPVTKNRRNHGAAFINSTGSVVIYGGSQDSNLINVPSSQTFVISIYPPFAVVSYSSRGQPPVISPQMLPWNESHAAMLGSRAGTKRLWAFSKDGGWGNLGITVERPVTTKASSILVRGDDGSKSLETLDVSVSPNVVTRTVLVDPNDSVQAGKVISSRSHSHRRVSNAALRSKRDITIANWPTYNDTLAPTTIRQGYSIAQDPSGRLVVVGGNEEDPLSIFDTRKNSWVNATELFSGAQKPLTMSSSSSASGTATPTPTPSTTTLPASTTSAAAKTGAAATPSHGRSIALTVLGATLGGIFGVAVLFALFLVCLRHRRRSRQRDAHLNPRHPDQSASQMEKDRLSFADRAPATFVSSRGDAHSVPAVSHTAAPYTATFPANSAHFQRPLEPREDVYAQAPFRGDLTEHSVSFVGNTSDSKGSRTDGAGKQRSSGWSKYFSGASATELKHMRSNRRSAATARTLSTQSQSEGEDVRDSAKVPPLHIGQGQAQSPRVTRGYGAPVAMAGQIAIGRSGSSSTDISRDGAEDVFASGLRSGSHEEHQWTPVGEGQDYSAQRVPSSIYTAGSRVGSTILPTNHVRNGSYARESSGQATGGGVFPRNSSHGSVLGGGPAVGGVIPLNQLMSDRVLRDRERQREQDLATAFPRPGTGGATNYQGARINQPEDTHVRNAAYREVRPERGETSHSDMSWLNLGNRESQ